GSNDGYSPDQAVIATISDPPFADYCRFNYPPVHTGDVGQSLGVFGILYELDLTNQTTGVDVDDGIRAEAGYGPSGTMPDENNGWVWVNATANPAWNGSEVGEPNNDEYMATLTLPGPGSYHMAYRFSLDRGRSWLLCDTGTGSDNGYQVADAATLETECGGDLVDGCGGCVAPDDPCLDPAPECRVEVFTQGDSCFAVGQRLGCDWQSLVVCGRAEVTACFENVRPGDTVTCDVACCDGNAVDTCEDIDCGENGQCEGGRCRCDQGFDCARCQNAVVDPCVDVACGDNGRCENGVCRCTPGFMGPQCDMVAPDPCDALECGDNGDCSGGRCVCTNGYLGARCELAPIECADGESCDGHIIFSDAPPMPKAPLVGYVGGSNYDATFRFNHVERLGHYHMVILGFLDDWNTNTPQRCPGTDEYPVPIEPGLDALPSLNTNGCIASPWMDKPAHWLGCKLNQCGGRADQDGSVAQAVLQYQRGGGRVLISLGGARGDVLDMTPAKGTALADAVWQMYLGGTDPRYRGWRPFGPNVVLDGVDLDLEDTPADCPNGPNCLAIQEGWYNFTKRIRQLMDDDNRKSYYITAVPINTKYGDPQAGSFPGWGAYVYGYLPGIAPGLDIWDPLSQLARSALNDQPAKSVYRILYLVDYLWAQYYPSPVSITLNGDVWVNDLLAWTQMAARPGPDGEESRCRVGVGVPFGPGAANGGQISADDAMRKVREALAEHAILRRHFGGMFGWDEYWDYTNYRQNPDEGLYSQQLRTLLDAQALLDLLD
ncbi:MAG: glycosyl hydrolase family 18 protein, partial [Myxococcota bacterium]|nr:glycosyl hydrolase family 18 protein [Myxococcota bacterium]